MKAAASQPVVNYRAAADTSDAARQREVEQLAHWLDEAFELPGLRWRFGLDAIFGLIPGLGDTLTSLVSLYILMAANRLGVPRITLARMALNVGIDYVVGSLPILGDAFDFFWKSNKKNVALLRRHLAATPESQRTSRRGDWLFVGGLIAVLLMLLVGSVVAAWYLVSFLLSQLWTR